MTRFARVVVESKLLQLDRQFDFLVPAEFSQSLSFGHRVGFFIGRSKTKQTGFVVELLAESEHATSPLVEIIGERPVLTKEIYHFAREVANRQCVALGEILSSAIPDHMARTSVEAPEPSLPASSVVEPMREILLANGKQSSSRENLFPAWMEVFVDEAKKVTELGQSAILLVPEISDVETLASACEDAGLNAVSMRPDQKRSERFKVFHRSLDQTAIVVGTRSAIYAPVANLALICMADDLDDSWREQGSPHTHTRELALMRAGSSVSLLFAAPYRSLELQRLVELGYLKERKPNGAPPRLSYTDSGLRLDSASFEMAKEAVRKGPLLILMPRKGSSAAAYCQSCGERQRCDCGGFVWEPTSGRFECRVCSTVHTSCPRCQSSNLRRGRTGSQRTVAEIGKAFPNSKIYEATAEKNPSITDRPNTIVVATPGAAPRLKKGYSGLLVLDCDIWLTRQHLTAEQLALRDWTEALELLAPSGRAVFEGLGSHLGQPLALWQHVELARSAIQETASLSLPPSVRIASLEANAKVMGEALAAVARVGAEVIRNSGTKALIRFRYSQGMDVAKELRSIAIKATARATAAGNRRGLKIIMDDLKELNS
jgi:primosomal protein N' (replication factor Y)